MTLKHSFFDALRVRETLRRQSWAILLGLIGFFFALPLPIAMTAQSVAENTYYHTYVTERVSWLLGVGNPFVRIGICMMAVICGIQAFSYLHSRQQTDFYHSMPIRRGALFAQKMLTSLLSVLPCYLIMQAAAVLAAFGTGFGSAVRPGAVAQAVLVHMLMFLLVWSLAALCSILCGNTIISLLLFGWAAFSPLIAWSVTVFLQGQFYQTFSIAGSVEEGVLSKLSPIMQYLLGMGRGYNVYALNEAAAAVPVGTLVWALLCMAVFTALGAFAFIRRGSEQAGSALAFRWMQGPVKIWCTVIMAASTGVLFHLIVGEMWMYFGFVVGGLLTHGLMEIIYHFDFRALFKNVRTLFITAVLFALVIGGMKMDITGYDQYLPARGTIASASISGVHDSRAAWLSMAAPGEIDLREPESIDAIYALAELGIDSLGDEEYYSYYTVRFTTAGGRQISRQYRYNQNDGAFKNLMEQLLFSEEFVRSASPVHRYDLRGDGTERLLVYTAQAGWNEDPAAYTDDREQTAAIVEALRREMLLLTAEEANSTKPVLQMQIAAQKEKGQIIEERNGQIFWNRGYSSGYAAATEPVAIYPQYEETLALIAEYLGVTPMPLYMDEEITAVRLSRSPYHAPEEAELAELDDSMPMNTGMLPFAAAEVSIGYTEEETVMVDDPELIRELLKHAVTARLADISEGWRENMEYTAYTDPSETYVYYIPSAGYRNGDWMSIFFDREHVPYALMAQCFDQSP